MGGKGVSSSGELINYTVSVNMQTEILDKLPQNVLCSVGFKVNS